MTTVILLTVTGLVSGLAIGIVVKFFGTTPNPLEEKLLELVPGANCGGCGFAGCEGYAKAMADGSAKPGACPLMNDAVVQEICALLGVESEPRKPMVAVVCCSGDDDHAQRMAFYNGVNDCQNAMLVAGGGKGCVYGCLGLGSCARACPYGAIEIRPNHIAVVHPELCVGCGKCVLACPRRLIKLTPKSAPVHVFCSSPERGALKRKFCSAACIGCRKCVKEAGENQVSMNGSLAVINYNNPPDAAVAAACPTGALRTTAIMESTKG